MASGVALGFAPEWQQAWTLWKYTYFHSFTIIIRYLVGKLWLQRLEPFTFEVLYVYFSTPPGTESFEKSHPSHIFSQFN